eukprot:CCRYP_000804-RA/>CCRYP_000804-RA protein AED:0.63 eAED:0.36 QI:0/0/0/0.5/1/1/2/0/296
MKMGEFAWKCKEVHCYLPSTEPYSPWSKSAENAIWELKKEAAQKLTWSGVPQQLWCFALEYELYVRLHTAHEIYTLDGHVSEMVVSVDHLAPKVLAGVSYHEEVDECAIGVLLYELLVGVPPFHNGEPHVSTKTSLPHTMSKSAKGLISNLLEEDPMKRLPLEGLLKHNFVFKPSGGRFFSQAEKLKPNSKSKTCVTADHCEAKGGKTAKTGKEWQLSDFELGHHLRKGAYGRVFLARKHCTKHIVVIKIINKLTAAKDEQQVQIPREINCQNCLHHKNIARTYGYFLTGMTSTLY